MTQRTLPMSRVDAGTPWESYIVLASLAVLSSLAVADRFAAWLIGQFPTSAALWQLRFEYLRPIGVFYDIASVRLGAMSGMEFSLLVLGASVVLAAGALSPIRLLRASSLHAVLASCLVLFAYSFDLLDPEGAVGSPSSSYALLGAITALPVLRLCLRIHADYIGLNAASFPFVRHFGTVAMRMRHRVGGLLADLLEPLFPATSRVQVVLARRNLVDNRRPRH